MRGGAMCSLGISGGPKCVMGPTFNDKAWFGVYGSPALKVGGPIGGGGLKKPELSD